MHVVFLYKIQDTYAVGVLDAANATVLHGAKNGWVLHMHATGVERYFIEDMHEHVLFCVCDRDIASALVRLTLKGAPLAENPLPPAEPQGLQEFPVVIPHKKGRR